MSDQILQVILCDQQAELVREWQQHFAVFEDVEVLNGDLLDVWADAYVSPANSHGWMDGGFDLALRERFMGNDIEGRVQKAIGDWGGLLPVGEAVVVETGDDEVPYLVVAPTMEVPSDVAFTSNAYKAMLALLRTVRKFNRDHENLIEVVAVPGLCTGVGGMEPRVAALQMHQAYSEWLDQSG